MGIIYTYKEIILENGIIKLKSIDFKNLKNEEKQNYYEVDKFNISDCSTVIIICNFKYKVLSNQN